jgi:hypothetical protein
MSEAETLWRDVSRTARLTRGERKRLSREMEGIRACDTRVIVMERAGEPIS